MCFSGFQRTKRREKYQSSSPLPMPKYLGRVLFFTTAAVTGFFLQYKYNFPIPPLFDWTGSTSESLLQPRTKWVNPFHHIPPNDFSQTERRTNTGPSSFE